MRSLTCLLILLAFAGAVLAQAPSLHLSNLFTDHMVLQREKPLPVWGWAAPGATVTVTFAEGAYSTIADNAGAWRVTMKPCKAGGPYALKIANDKIVITRADILVGDVWVCSGQSNMEMAVGGVLNAKAEMAAAIDPNIRFFQVPHKLADSPQTDVVGKWVVCSPQTVGGYSAVAYFFAREIRKQVNVPIGLLQDCWSGSCAEAWIPPTMLKADPALRPVLARRFMTKEEYLPVKQAYDSAMAKWLVANIAVDTGNEGEKAGWAKPDFDDRGWDAMRAPGSWERAEHGLYLNGAVWHRRAIDIPADWAGHALTLKLGKIGDEDTTYVNDARIGATGVNDPKANEALRVYTIPATQVKAGRLLIAVRVFNRWGEGGFLGPADQFSLAPADIPAATPLSLAGDWRYHVERQIEDPAGPIEPPAPDDFRSPGKIFDGMIAPVIPFAIKGAIWYQGESNGGNAYQYRVTFPAMIQGWRQAWGQGDFPFYYVQLANWIQRQHVPGECCWAEVREAQLITLKLRNTGMAVAIDVGEANSIHPLNKQDVGKRLALWALAKDYGQKVVYSGPLYKKMRVKGNSIILSFDHADGGLAVRDGKPLTAFAIAGADRRFVWADAKIVGNTVVVSSPHVPRPVAVRYGWHYNPDCTLINGAGLPASPFRTDDWPGVTAGIE